MKLSISLIALMFSSFAFASMPQDFSDCLHIDAKVFDKVVNELTSQNPDSVEGIKIPGMRSATRTLFADADMQLWQSSESVLGCTKSLTLINTVKSEARVLPLIRRHGDKCIYDNAGTTVFGQENLICFLK